MADDFRAYRAVTPPGGVMGALPKAEPPAAVMSDQERAYAEQYAADLRKKYAVDDFRAPAPGPSTMDSLGTAASNIFKSMSLFNLVPEAARAAYSGFTLPGDVASGKAPPMYLENGELNPEMMGRVMDFAGLATLGPGIVPAEANTLRSGISVPKRMFGGVERTEEEIAKLLERGMTEEKLLAARAAREAEAEAKKARKQAQLQAKGLATAYIEPPLKTRQDGLYSKAEQALLQFKQPDATVKEYINFLKGKGVKDSELKALGLDTMNPDEVLSTKGIQDLVVERTPRLERIEYKGKETRHSTHVEPVYPQNKEAEYREIIYKLPTKYTQKNDLGPVPTFEEIRDRLRQEMADTIETARAERAGTDNPLPDRFTVDSPNIASVIDMQARQELEAQLKNRQAGIFTVPSHWGDMENPLLHLRVTDIKDGNRKIFKLQEVQSDWGQQKRMATEGRRSYRKDIPDAPWVMDDSWVDLAAKKAIVEAVESGADMIELVPGIVHSERWGGQPGLVGFYDKKMAGAFDRAAKEAGATLGEKIETQLKLSPDEVDQYFDQMSYDDLYDKFGLDLNLDSDMAAWGDARYFANRERAAPGYLEETKKQLLERQQKARERLEASKAEYQRIRNQMQAVSDKGLMDAGMMDSFKNQLREASENTAEDFRAIVALNRDLNVVEKIAPKILKEIDQISGKPVERYTLEITPELRDFVRQRGFKNFAKGGIVDIANYLAWSR